MVPAVNEAGRFRFPRWRLAIPLIETEFACLRALPCAAARVGHGVWVGDPTIRGLSERGPTAAAQHAAF